MTRRALTLISPLFSPLISLLVISLLVISPLAISSLFSTGCSRPTRTSFTHDAYIWQRHWTPALERAALASASRVAAWRVLAAEIDGRGHVIESAPHLDVLARTGKPVTVVIRISGQASAWNEADIADIVQRSLTLVQRWREAGIDVAGLEVDHDCATAGLRRYASFLERLRQATSTSIEPDAAHGGIPSRWRTARGRVDDPVGPRNLALSITALPAWLDGERLGDVLRQIDYAVLQVHAVQHPRLGLFDRDRAYAWAMAWAKATTVPFRIALPTYGSRVTWTPAGRITAIESEAPSFADSMDSHELFATPRDILTFIDTLRRQPPSHFAGFTWFRLPTEDDERAWSVQTWHAVMDGRTLAPDIAAIVERHPTIPGLYDVFLRNRGDVEDALPASVTVTAAGSCEAADAIAPYTMERRDGAIEFNRVAPRLLGLHRQTLIGWVRCPIGEVQARAHS